MNAWVLRVEGVNFDATIDDTNDLSTMRGGSLALLGFPEKVAGALAALPEKPKVERIFAGASLCAFRVESASADFATKARQVVYGTLANPEFSWKQSGKNQTIPLNYLTVVVDVAPTTAGSASLPAIDADVDRAEARNHARQFRQWTIAPLPDLQVDARARVEADRFENIRPATAWIYAPKRHLLHSTQEDQVSDNVDSDKYHTSESVAARRNYGRDQRQQFYGTELSGYDLDGNCFTDSITSIAADLPASYEVPLSPRSKVAVFYADGNRFGALRKAAGLQNFSTQLAGLRKDLLRSILDWYKAGITQNNALADAFSIFDAGEQKRALRFETLLWGGDEVLFVLPAWLAVPFAQGFFEVTKGWTIKDRDGGVHPVTHAASVAIAHYKTPVRQLKQVAKRTADLAKDSAAAMRKRNSVTFEIYESLAPPDTDGNFEAERLRIYGRHESLPDECLTQYLALPGDDFAEAMAHMQVLQKNFPRSQIYAALRMLRGTGSLWAERSDASAKAGLEKYRRFNSEGYDLLLDHLLPSFKRDDLPRRPLSLDLALIATLWDYFVPFGALPAFTAPTGNEG